MSALAPTDVEAALVAWLPGGLSGEVVSTDVPNPRPPAHVRVSRIGPGAHITDPKVDRALVLLEAWAPTSVAASDLALAVYRRVTAGSGEWLSASTYCYRATASAPVSLPDPDTASPRYQFTAQLHCRMA